MGAGGAAGIFQRGRAQAEKKMVDVAVTMEMDVHWRGSINALSNLGMFETELETPSAIAFQCDGSRSRQFCGGGVAQSNFPSPVFQFFQFSTRLWQCSKGKRGGKAEKKLGIERFLEHALTTVQWWQSVW